MRKPQNGARWYVAWYISPICPARFWYLLPTPPSQCFYPKISQRLSGSIHDFSYAQVQYQGDCSPSPYQPWSLFVSWLLVVSTYWVFMLVITSDFHLGTSFLNASALFYNDAIDWIVPNLIYSTFFVFTRLFGTVPITLKKTDPDVTFMFQNLFLSGKRTRFLSIISVYLIFFRRT